MPKTMFGDFLRPTFYLLSLWSFFLFPRCDNDIKRPVPLEAEVIPVLHSVTEANASDESDGVARQEEEQIGICTVCFSILVSYQQDVKIIST